jgi:hypothetical protein
MLATWIDRRDDNAAVLYFDNKSDIPGDCSCQCPQCGDSTVLTICLTSTTSPVEATCRVEQPAADVVATLASTPSATDLANLFKSDQLGNLLRGASSHPLQAFHELCPPPAGCPPFLPTYKLLSGSDEYDPRRTPSWTDRIFWRCNYLLESPRAAPGAVRGLAAPSPVTQTSYTALKDVRQSDHRPVVASFTIALKHTAPLLLDESVDAAAYGRGRSLRRWLTSSRPAHSVPLTTSPVVIGPLCHNAAVLALQG